MIVVIVMIDFEIEGLLLQERSAMKKVKIEDAVGMELCHDVTAIRDGFKGAAYRRGHIITEEDVPDLLCIGKKTVFVWEEQAGEIHEEDCALRLSAMAGVEGASWSAPSEGKVVLTAGKPGMFRVDRELLHQINDIGDITFVTLPDHYPVEAGARLASVRIVPLVTKEEQIIAAENLCENRRLLELLPYRQMKTGIIITGSEIYTGKIKDKFEPVIRAKLEHYPAEILGVTICDDDLDMITEASMKYIGEGADLLIYSGGMSVDPDDLTPTAMRQLSDTFIKQGVPAQPGNMTTIAYRGDTMLIGVPSAAIKSNITVLDAVLPQIFTGLKFTKEDLVRLGDGGLCQQCESCHFPNCTYGRY